MSRLAQGIIAEHLDEAEFLVGQRRLALDSPVHTLADVADGEEERLLAHVDGLVLAGAPAADALLWPALLEGGEPRAVAAGLALLSADEPALREGFFARVAECPVPLVPAWVEALTLAEAVTDARLVAELEGPARELALGALALRAVDVGPRVLAKIELVGPAIRLRRAATVDTLPRFDDVAGGLEHPDLAVAIAGLELGLARAEPEAWRVVQEASEQPSRLTPFALEVLATLGTPAQAARLGARLQEPALRPATIYALGFAGTVDAVDAILPWLDDPVANPLVGEAFSAITGFDPVAARARRRRAEPEALPALEDDDLEADLKPDRDADLDAIDADLVRAAWARLRAQLEPGVRYRRGAPLTPSQLFDAVESEPTRRRGPWAREAWVRTRGRVRVALTALTARQRRQLAAAR